jgi:spheroidene monooxygenase
MVAPQPVVSLCFYRFSRLRDRLWAFGQMGLARLALRRVPGIGAWKLMGAGSGEGFTPVPDWGVVAVLATWPDLAAARSAVEDAPVFRRYARRASERFVLYLGTTSVRGRWGGATPFAVGATLGDGPSDGPVAALTRGTVRTRVLLRFWRQAAAISRRIGGDPNVVFKAGVGEVPWLHQVTFTVWPDARAMAAFARAEGSHAAAIRAVRAEGWFAEELYARFAVLGRAGTWGGRDPLAGLDRDGAAALAAE